MAEIGDGSYAFTAELWLHQGPDSWHFISLAAEVSDDIRARTEERSPSAVREWM